MPTLVFPIPSRYQRGQKCLGVGERKMVKERQGDEGCRCRQRKVAVTEMTVAELEK